MARDRLSTTFAALADPTRRAILARLALGETSVTELAEPFEISLPAVSKHLKVLERAGLIARGRAAQWRPCRLEATPLKSAKRLARGLSPVLGAELGSPRRLPARAAGDEEKARTQEIVRNSTPRHQQFAGRINDQDNPYRVVAVLVTKERTLGREQYPHCGAGAA